MLRFALCLLVVVAPLAARAQDAPAPASDGAAEQARAHFDRGTRAYNLGEFATALDEYKAAYKLQPLPAFLFNIGQCHFALGDYERAIFFYEGFLRESSPNAAHRAQVEGFITDARQRLEAQRAKPAEPPREEPTRVAPATTTTTTTTAPAATTAPATTPTAATPTTAGDDDAPGWLWPSVAGAAAVVAAVAATAIALVLSQPEPVEGELPTLDARRRS